MKMWNQITKLPKYFETTTTLFELIAIKVNIRKCSSCGGKLKDGQDPLLVHNFDEVFYIRHQKKDHF